VTPAADSPTGATPTPPIEVLEVAVPAALDGVRLDRGVSMLSGLARSAVARLVESGLVEVDGIVETVRARPLVGGQRLRVTRGPSPVTGPEADDSVRFGVVAEDAHLIVVDKPAGLVVHHGAGQSGGTLVDGLLARYPELAGLAGAGAGDPSRPGIVHRLDKATSGLLVVARTPDAYRSLTGQFRSHLAGRTYRALVAGRVEADDGVVDAPIGRSRRDPTRMAVAAGGRSARTTYRVCQRFELPTPTTLLDLDLETGRTHQIRVHLCAIGHPVVGDLRYGREHARPGHWGAAMTPGRVFLHARLLSVEHPDGSGRASWESPLPTDLAAVLRALEAGR
jgi:23S rRNA pseudouridine1911/1915/1917 synthase